MQNICEIITSFLTKLGVKYPIFHAIKTNDFSHANIPLNLVSWYLLKLLECLDCCSECAKVNVLFKDYLNWSTTSLKNPDSHNGALFSHKYGKKSFMFHTGGG